ncbi:ATP-binding protein [Luteolibacter sp. GHJ8]|uniref:ATP-binding protein n=1 Tax=Luteolibacter rhizosphaerae TaxID=2989719 RepID=A0ABT3FZS1_9BACT|nr:ATP-binding protein [Luteolibacter rhizosphaerae]MCW1913080.1 ATP-binding protein [Luteolibacter rhizosphaerae]
MTVHDVTHLDALWETASSVAEGAVNVNPAEAFVLGASILLHDAAMSIAAFPGGLAQIKATVAWKDAVARLALVDEDRNVQIGSQAPSPEEIESRILPEVLRRLHAERAEELAEQSWVGPGGSRVYLIEDSELRRFYGPTIGQIAHSHWWPVQKIDQEFSEDLGALPSRTVNRVDRVKLACLLRVADALHLDSRRAPRFLREITNPTGVSALHWAFQERLARPHIELDAVVFTTGQPFGKEDAEAWWLANDTLNAVDRELRDVDLLLQARGREVLKARRIKGAGSSEILARTVQTRGWRPVDARLQVSDVPRIVETLGGSKLYGNDPSVPLRELIQNAADAVQARRRFQSRASDWGLIKVSIAIRNENEHWLVVEDSGIGMSESVLTGPLLDFGTSFWRSPQAMEEFPGLMAAGMHAVGRFGIGFFSIFMLGPVVRVYSRRCDRGSDSGRLLEFRGGTSSRPILSPEAGEPVPIDGGTRVEVLLKRNPYEAGGLLSMGAYSKETIPLAALVAAVAPNLDVAIETTEAEEAVRVVHPGDWLQISDSELTSRLNPASKGGHSYSKSEGKLMRSVQEEDGQIFGRAFISPTRYSSSPSAGWVTISGLRAARLSNVEGIFVGEALTASRDAAQPLVTREALAFWASKQAELIAAEVEDEERQALSAEVVLECGGDIGALKFIRWGGSWLATDEFKARLIQVTEIAISFDGEFHFDEDKDDVHPREFRSDFEESEDVAIVLEHQGSILSFSNTTWPRSLLGQARSRESNLEALTRKIILEVWQEFEEAEEEQTVGKVGFSDISRDITVFRRPDVPK